MSSSSSTTTGRARTVQAVCALATFLACVGGGLALNHAPSAAPSAAPSVVAATPGLFDPSATLDTSRVDDLRGVAYVIEAAPYAWTSPEDGSAWTCGYGLDGLNCYATTDDVYAADEILCDALDDGALYACRYAVDVQAAAPFTITANGEIFPGLDYHPGDDVSLGA